MGTSIRRHIVASLSFGFVASLIGAAHAQSARQATASARGFSECRAQEKLGDARACWRLFLQRFASTGSEAELAFAEEHAAVPPPASEPTPARAKVVFSGPKATTVTLDGKLLGELPLDGTEVDLGAHTVVFALGGRQQSVSFSASRAETTVLPTTLEEPPAAPAASAAAPLLRDGAASTASAGLPDASKSGFAKGEVLDFCALAPSTDTTKFVKQRVVLFAPADAERLNGDEAFRGADAARVFRDVFDARFPMPRFHNVVVSAAPRKEWPTAASIPLADVESLLNQKPAQGDDVQNARLEREQKFARYSLECTDYVAFPVITSQSVKWVERKVKTSRGEQTVRSPVLSIGASLGIFHHEGSTLTRVATVEASVPGIADLASDAAAETVAASASSVSVGGVDVLAAAGKVGDAPSYISALPDPSCVLEKAPSGTAGLAACAGGHGEATLEQTLGNIDERIGPVCRKAMSTGEPARIVECETRARAFQLSRALQKEARSVPGWKLFGILARNAGDLGVNLGRAEGLSVGYAFEVRARDGERLGFFKVTDVGVGGEKAAAEPSHLTLRSGEAAEGARLEEYPQIGIVLRPYASFAALAIYGTDAVIRTPQFNARYALPSVVFGAGASVGYDLSGLFSWPETFVRVGAAYYEGRGTGTATSHIPIELWFEKGIYLARRTMLFGSLGGYMQMNNVRFKPSPALPEAFTLSGTNGGPAARLGVDVMLHPDWSLQLEGIARVPVAAVRYQTDSTSAAAQTMTERQDRLATFGGNLGIAKTF